MGSHRLARLLAALFALTALLGAGLLAGCSDDDDDSAEPAGEEPEASESAESTNPDDTIDPATEVTAPPDDPTGTGLVCEPVVPDDAPSEGVGFVEVTMDEFSIDVDPDGVDSGWVFLQATIIGDKPHDLTIVAAPSAEDLPTLDDGRVDRDAVAGDIVAELGVFPDACEATFPIGAGSYIVFSNQITDDEATDETLADFEEGMYATLTVE